MSIAASELELSSAGEEYGTSTPNEVSDSHLTQSLDVPASISPPDASRPVIAVDLDDVLSQTNATVAKWHNETYGTKMTLDDFYYTYLWKNPYWGSLETTHAKLRDFYATPDLYDADPVPGAREGIQILHDLGFRLVIVTARGPDVKDDTWKWVNKWFPGLFDSIICTGHLTAESNGHAIVAKLSKAEICADLKALLLIDDSTENALKVSTASPPTQVLLFGHYEWNKRFSIPSDAVDSMSFDIRLQIEGGREFWKEERFEDLVPKDALLQRVKDWSEVIQWVKSANLV